MGFFAKLFFGPKCNCCGQRDMQEVASLTDFPMCICRSCGTVVNYGRTPRCYVCGTPQTDFGISQTGVYLPQCPKCGYLYDCMERDY